MMASVGIICTACSHRRCRRIVRSEWARGGADWRMMKIWRWAMRWTGIILRRVVRSSWKMKMGKSRRNIKKEKRQGCDVHLNIFLNIKFK